MYRNSIVLITIIFFTLFTFACYDTAKSQNYITTSVLDDDHNLDEISARSTLFEVKKTENDENQEKDTEATVSKSYDVSIAINEDTVVIISNLYVQTFIDGVAVDYGYLDDSNTKGVYQGYAVESEASQQEGEENAGESKLYLLTLNSYTLPTSTESALGHVSITVENTEYNISTTDELTLSGSGVLSQIK